MHTCVVACSAGQAHLRNGDSLLQGAAQCAIYYFPACRGCQRHCTGYSFGRAPSTATSQTKNPQNCLHSPEGGAGKGKRPRTVPPTSTVCVCPYTSTGIAETTKGGTNIEATCFFLAAAVLPALLHAAHACFLLLPRSHTGRSS